MKKGRGRRKRREERKKKGWRKAEGSRMRVGVEEERGRKSLVVYCYSMLEQEHRKVTIACFYNF